MKFDVTAFVLWRDGQTSMTAIENAESLDDAIGIIKQWVEAGEIEQYGRGAAVKFVIHATPENVAEENRGKMMETLWPNG